MSNKAYYDGCVKSHFTCLALTDQGAFHTTQKFEGILMNVRQCEADFI